MTGLGASDDSGQASVPPGPPWPAGDAGKRVDAALAALNLRGSTPTSGRKAPADKLLEPIPHTGDAGFAMTIDGTTHTDRGTAGTHLIGTVAATLDPTGRPHVVAWLSHHPITATAADGHVVITTPDNRVAAAVPANRWTITDPAALVTKLEHQSQALNQVRRQLATTSTAPVRPVPRLGRQSPGLNL